MRFLTRLLISHTIPVLVLTLALAAAVAALLRIAVVLTTLREKELAVLHDEGQLHAAAWALDRELRHASLSCARGEAAGTIDRQLDARASELRHALTTSTHLSQTLRDVVAGFADVTHRARRSDLCTALLRADTQRRRAELDEQLTDFWVSRLEELHRAVEDKEGEAQRIAISATWLGIPLALLAFVFALLTARKLARLLEEPLRSLAETARLVGSGDFSTPVRVQGPPEVMTLAAALERMRMQLYELEELKQGFLASVSHELRTPLTKIREALSLLQDGAVGALDERQARVVRIARTACEREIRMVNALLDLSRLRAGSPIRLVEGESIDAALEAAVEDEASEAQQRGIEVELLAQGSAAPSCLDPELMERAIANLIRNAVSVSRRGTTVWVERTIGPPSSTYPDGVIHITVKDHGPGVPAEIRDRVFDPFVTRPVGERSVGVGLGLPLAREVARAHGGDLELAECGEQGSTFRLSVPAGGANPHARADSGGSKRLHLGP